MAVHRWRRKEKSGRHVMQLNGKKLTVLPGQVLECTLEKLGSFASKYDDLGLVPGQPVELGAAKSPPLGFEIISKGSGYFDVINPDNPAKPINAKGLRKDAAEKLIQDLEG